MKTIQHVIQETYKQVSKDDPIITYSDVEEIVTFMFEEFKNELDKHEHAGVRIKNVGVFLLKPKRVIAYCMRIDQLLNKLTPGGVKHTIILENHKKALPLFNEVLSYYTRMIELRKQYLKNKYNNNNDNENDDND
jgi:hypothetical protein